MRQYNQEISGFLEGKAGLYDAFKKIIDTVMFNICGIKVIEHKYLSEVPRVSPEIRKEDIEEAKNVVSRI